MGFASPVRRADTSKNPQHPETQRPPAQKRCKNASTGKSPFFDEEYLPPSYAKANIPGRGIVFLLEYICASSSIFYAPIVKISIFLSSKAQSEHKKYIFGDFEIPAFWGYSFFLYTQFLTPCIRGTLLHFTTTLLQLYYILYYTHTLTYTRRKYGFFINTLLQKQQNNITQAQTIPSKI